MLARAKRASASRVIAELVESGLQAQDAKRERFLRLADRLTRSKDRAEQDQIKEELARLTFGDELASIKFWLEAKAAKLDAKLRASIAAGLNDVCSRFDDPKIREVCAPDPIWENFRGFDRLIEEGQIVALRVPKSQLKTVSTIVGTMTKLNFFDSVLNRLALAEYGSEDVGRGVFFVADEYDGTPHTPATATSSRSAAKPSVVR